MQQHDVDSYREAADAVKLEFFGETSFSFHEPHMRNRLDRYYLRGGEKRQQAFDAALDRLVQQSNFVAVGVCIRKDVFKTQFVETGIDPYLQEERFTDVYPLAILLLLERYIDFLAHEAEPRFGRVTFESQGPVEDAYHQLEYARILLEGSQWVPDSAFRNWLETGLQFEPKPGRSDPMELADMFFRDLYEWTRDGCCTSPGRWGSFSDKVYCREDGRMGKFGVKVFPDSDIRDLVEAHRVRCGASTAS